MEIDRPTIVRRLASEFWDEWRQSAEYRDAMQAAQQEFINVMLWGHSHPERFIGGVDLAREPDHTGVVVIDDRCTVPTGIEDQFIAFDDLRYPVFEIRKNRGEVEINESLRPRNRHERRRGGRPERKA